MAACLGVLVLVGCGGKPETTPAPPTPPGRQTMPDLGQQAPATSAATPNLPAVALAPATPTAEAPATTEGLSVQDTADLENLSFLLRDYVNVNMQYPKDLNDLVKAGLLKSVPEPPPGKTFMIDRKNNRVVVVKK